MELLTWIFLGAIVGWIANTLTGKGQTGCITNILIGMIGSLIGGLVVTFFTEGKIILTAFTDFNLVSLLISVLGAVIFLAILAAVKK
ncbi:GlsB/YeaQ/YmgE family stress response membrane protein [Candidatus Dojkabacteria bacterium]|nr:GlsB/YeaQ/YmgE family stress response membrane protein [Candidatus Dojkabacteria bacterium]